MDLGLAGLESGHLEASQRSDALDEPRLAKGVRHGHDYDIAPGACIRHDAA